MIHLSAPEASVLQARDRAHGVQGLPPEDLATRLPLLHPAQSHRLRSLRQVV